MIRTVSIVRVAFCHWALWRWMRVAVPTAKPQNSETIMEKYWMGSRWRKDSTGSQGIGLPKTTPTKQHVSKNAIMDCSRRFTDCLSR